MTGQRIRVVVVGGGYAGSIAANRLRRRKDVDISLVNPRPEFIQRTRLHQYATAGTVITARYQALLSKGVSLIVDTVDRIEIGARSVRLTSGDSLEYDYLIYAVGSTGMSSPTVPGAAEHSYQIGEFEGAQQLSMALANLPPAAPVTVVGGGPTGIETAAEIAEQGYAATLVGGGALVPMFTPAGRHSVLSQLSALGVVVREKASVTQVGTDAVMLDDGTSLPGAVTVWAAGFGVPELARASGLSTDTLGRLLTDETLTSIDDDRVFAAGDAASPSGRPLRMACQSAVPMGLMAAESVLSRIAGGRPADIDLGFNGLAVSLGRRAATIQTQQRDETPKDRIIDGRAAAPIKNLGLKAAVWGIRAEALLPGSAIWPKGGRTAPEDAWIQ